MFGNHQPPGSTLMPAIPQTFKPPPAQPYNQPAESNKDVYGTPHRPQPQAQQQSQVQRVNTSIGANASLPPRPQLMSPQPSLPTASPTESGLPYAIGGNQWAPGRPVEIITSFNNSSKIPSSNPAALQQSSESEQAGGQLQHQQQQCSTLASPTARYAYVPTPASPVPPTHIQTAAFAHPPSPAFDRATSASLSSPSPYNMHGSYPQSASLFHSIPAADINSLYASTSQPSFMQFNGQMIPMNLNNLPQMPNMNIAMPEALMTKRTKEPAIRKNACAVCHQAKTSCNGQRPCDRCIRLDRQSLCVDRPRKQPRRTEKGKKKDDDENSDDNANTDDDSTKKKVKIEIQTDSALPKSSVADTNNECAVPHSSDSSSSSISVGSNNDANLTDELHGIDLSISNNSAHSLEESHRKLSHVYTRCHQHQQTRDAIISAQKKGLVSPYQVAYYVWYLGSVLSEEDFRSLMSMSDTSASGANTDPSSPACSATVLTFLNTVIGPRPVVPRWSFNFSSSFIDAVEDESSFGLDFAALTVQSSINAGNPWEREKIKNSAVKISTPNTTSGSGGDGATPTPTTPQILLENEKGNDNGTSAATNITTTSITTSTTTTSVPPSPSASSQPSLITSSSSAFSSWTASSQSSTAANADSQLPIIDVAMTVRVNREFERLFGYSQRQMRDLFAVEGGKMLYRLLAPASIPVLSKLLTQGMLGGPTEWRKVVTIINKFGGHIEALLIGRWLLDEQGIFRCASYSFAALPEDFSVKHHK